MSSFHLSDRLCDFKNLDLLHADNNNAVFFVILFCHLDGIGQLTVFLPGLLCTVSHNDWWITNFFSARLMFQSRCKFVFLHTLFTMCWKTNGPLFLRQILPWQMLTLLSCSFYLHISSQSLVNAGFGIHTRLFEIIFYLKGTQHDIVSIPIVSTSTISFLFSSF